MSKDLNATLPGELVHTAHRFLDYLDREPSSALQIDRLQSFLANAPQTPMPLKHVFTPGLYTREIFMPAGTFVISKIHKTEHPFVISKGRVSVWSEDSGVVTLQAPHTGITKPGTRRLLIIHEDTVWTTFHPTNKTDLEEIERDLILPREVEPIPIAIAAKEHRESKDDETQPHNI